MCESMDLLVNVIVWLFVSIFNFFNNIFSKIFDISGRSDIGPHDDTLCGSVPGCSNLTASATFHISGIYFILRAVLIRFVSLIILFSNNSFGTQLLWRDRNHMTEVCSDPFNNIFWTCMLIFFSYQAIIDNQNMINHNFMSPKFEYFQTVLYFVHYINRHEYDKKKLIAARSWKSAMNHLMNWHRFFFKSSLMMRFIHIPTTKLHRALNSNFLFHC